MLSMEGRPNYHFCCCHCGQKFNGKCQLKVHLCVIHLDWLPYSCHYCNYKGSKSSVLSHCAQFHSVQLLNITYCFDQEKKSKLDQWMELSTKVVPCTCDQNGCVPAVPCLPKSNNVIYRKSSDPLPLSCVNNETGSMSMVGHNNPVDANLEQEFDIDEPKQNSDLICTNGSDVQIPILQTLGPRITSLRLLIKEKMKRKDARNFPLEVDVQQVVSPSNETNQSIEPKLEAQEPYINGDTGNPSVWQLFGNVTSNENIGDDDEQFTVEVDADAAVAPLSHTVPLIRNPEAAISTLSESFIIRSTINIALAQETANKISLNYPLVPSLFCNMCHLRVNVSERNSPSKCIRQHVINRHLEEKLLECRVCGYGTNNITRMREHLTQKHKEKAENMIDRRQEMVPIVQKLIDQLFPGKVEKIVKRRSLKKKSRTRDVRSKKLQHIQTVIESDLNNRFHDMPKHTQPSCLPYKLPAQKTFFCDCGKGFYRHSNLVVHKQMHIY